MLEEEWFDAVQRGDDERVAELLIAQPELLTLRNDGCDALEIAAKKSHAKVVARLLAAGAIPSMNALHCAAATGSDDVVALLLEAKPNVIAETCNMGWTALHYAVHHGHEKVFAQLLAAKPELIDEVCGEDGEIVPRDSTVLHLAARSGHEDLLVQILALRPDMITAVDDLEWSAFRCAIHGGHQQLAERLLEIKPEFALKISKFNSRSILHCATRRHFTVNFMAKLWRMNPSALLHEDCSSFTAFHEAVARDRNDLIELFQWSLPLDVIASVFKTENAVFEERYKPVIESLFEPLFAWLSQDVTSIAFEYLGFEFVTRPHKRIKC